MIKLSTNTLPIVLFLIASTAFGQQAYKTEKLEMTPEFLNGEELVVCYLGEEIKQSVPFPKELRNIRARTNSTPTVIKVTYIGFDNNPEAKAAFQYAVDIWASLIHSPQPIHVQAQFSALDPGVLGSAIPSTFIRNFTNTPKYETWFAIALAEKIANKAFNGEGEFDVNTNFSSIADWYYDTSNPDAIEGTSKTDFASVVLHELAHGLGFMGVTDVTSGNGTIGLSDFPMTYTTFIETSAGDNLVVDIENGSTAMGDALTGNGLKYSGSTITARLYAPSEFAGGSTLSHLDNSIYNGTPNELMTPSIGFGGYIHSPGITLSMMQDFGWEFTYMIHEALANTEDFNQDFEILSIVTSDALEGFDTASLSLRYSTDGFASEDIKLPLLPTGNTDEYMATIPNPGIETTFSYYLQVFDKKQRIFTNPGSLLINEVYQPLPFQFTAALDDSIPSIEHTPIDFALDTKTEEKISATIVDFFMGVDTAFVEYLINDVPQPSFGMHREEGKNTVFAGIMNLTNIVAGDKVEYKITAIDSAASKNTSFDPATGFHEFFIEGISEAITEYENDFNSPSTDFLGDGFEVSTPVNFLDGAIHSLHPYEEAGAENEINYLYQLKTPIIVQEINTQVQFDEIVLVEPGELGARFGTEEFFDFVVVEASKDKGITWFAIIDGVDSSDETVWLSKYTSAIDVNNSTAVGDPTLYLLRSFDLLDNPSINTGDEILIRFRLFSDPFANGWGWAIDNLKIQKEVIASLDDYLEGSQFNLYPNPSTSGLFNLNGIFKKQPSYLQIKVTDIMGKSVLEVQPDTRGLRFDYELNLSAQPSGIYFVTMHIDGNQASRKIIKSR